MAVGVVRIFSDSFITNSLLGLTGFWKTVNILAMLRTRVQWLRLDLPSQRPEFWIVLYNKPIIVRCAMTVQRQSRVLLPTSQSVWRVSTQSVMLTVNKEATTKRALQHLMLVSPYGNSNLDVLELLAAFVNYQRDVVLSIEGPARPWSRDLMLVSPSRCALSWYNGLSSSSFLALLQMNPLKCPNCPMLGYSRWGR